MKLSNALIAATALSQCASAVAVPSPNNVALSSTLEEPRSYTDRQAWEDLWKRKGGGGKGGSSGGGESSGGSSSSGSSSSGSSSSSSSSGSSGSSSSSGSSTGKGSSTSNTGGSTTTGSGPKPAYGSSGTYYGGGSTTPYRSGITSPSGIVPGLLLGSTLGFWGTYWALGAYSYHYPHPYVFHNVTSNANETKPVDCLCRQDLECGCDDNTDPSYLSSVVGNGSYASLNQSLVTVADVNGTSTIFINGTLPNGTTSSGGTESPNSVAGMHSILQAMGWWPLATTVLALAYVV